MSTTYASLTYAERVALEAKAQRAIAVVANRDRLRRIREALARLEQSLSRSVEQERKYSPAYAEHCAQVGWLRDVAVLWDDVEQLEVR